MDTREQSAEKLAELLKNFANTNGELMTYRVLESIGFAEVSSGRWGLTARALVWRALRAFNDEVSETTLLLSPGLKEVPAEVVKAALRELQPTVFARARKDAGGLLLYRAQVPSGFETDRLGG
jgi:hypothetical protein